MLALCSVVFGTDVTAQSVCKGLANSQCGNNQSCTWVSGFTRRDGVKVSSYCRAKGGDGNKKSSKGEKRDMKKKAKNSDNKKKSNKKLSDKPEKASNKTRTSAEKKSSKTKKSGNEKSSSKKKSSRQSNAKKE